MKKYTFKNGDVVTSNLEVNEMLKRMRRLDLLIVMTECYETGVGVDICKKALRAYNKTENFTGIIRLSSLEKDFLGYLYENKFLSSEDIEVLNYYTKF